jgi:hypothetical protein
LQNGELTSGLSLDKIDFVIFGTAAGIVAVGRGAGFDVGAGAGGAGGASGATDSSLTFVDVCAKGSDEDPREEGDFASRGSCGSGAVTEIVGRGGVDTGVSSTGVGTGVALAAAALAAAATRGFLEFLSRS